MTENLKSRLKSWLFPTTDAWKNSWIWLFYLGYIALVLIYLGLVGAIDDTMLKIVLEFASKADGVGFDISNLLLGTGILILILIIQVAILLLILHAYSYIVTKFLQRILSIEETIEEEVQEIKS